jgi:hypothetical protein
MFVYKANSSVLIDIFVSVLNAVAPPSPLKKNNVLPLGRGFSEKLRLRMVSAELTRARSRPMQDLSGVHLVRPRVTSACSICVQAVGNASGQNKQGNGCFAVWIVPLLFPLSFDQFDHVSFVGLLDDMLEDHRPLDTKTARSTELLATFA